MTVHVPKVDDWYRLSADYPELRRAGNTTLKDYGYMEIFRYLDARPGAQNILEFGHGFNFSLFHRYGNERNAWGIDAFQDLPYFPRHDEWHRQMREGIARAPAKCTFKSGLLGNGDASDLPAEFFDAICSISVLEEMDVEATAPIIRHCYSLLKPGGVLIGTLDFCPVSYDKLPRYCKIQKEAGFEIEPFDGTTIDNYTLVENPAQARILYQLDTSPEYYGHWSTLWTIARKPDQKKKFLGLF